MATTKLSNLLNPQVLSEYIETKLVDKIKLSPLAVIGTTLKGRPGNTLTMPKWSYIGDAEDLAEGEADVPVILQSSDTEVTVKKAAKAVEITDEALLSGYGNPENEIADQLLLSIASKVEKDCYAALDTASLKHTSAINSDAIADATALFGEENEGQMYTFINHKDYNAIRKAAEFEPVDHSNAHIGGTVGRIWNTDVVVANRVPQGKAYVVKPGALGIELKRETNAETDRDILARINVYAVDKHYVAYLRDESKVVVISNE